jgi:RHS repeat-associated protein
MSNSRKLPIVALALAATLICFGALAQEQSPWDSCSYDPRQEQGWSSCSPGVETGGAIGAGNSGGRYEISPWFNNVVDEVFGQDGKLENLVCPKCSDRREAAEAAAKEALDGAAEGGRSVASSEWGRMQFVEVAATEPTREQVQQLLEDYGFPLPASPHSAMQPVGSRPVDPASRDSGSDPVSLGDGAFTYEATDHRLEGLEPRLELIRYYNSRSRFSGPLGRGWDHSLNPRLSVSGAGTCKEMVVVSLGNHQVQVFRPSYSASGTTTYVQEDGQRNWQLSRSDNTTCSWRLKLPNAYTYCFEAAGTPKTLAAKNGNSLVFAVSADGTIAEVKRLIGAAWSGSISFTYENKVLQTATFHDLEGPRKAITYKYTSQRGEALLETTVTDGGANESYSYHARPKTLTDELSLVAAMTVCERDCNAPSGEAACNATDYCKATFDAGQKAPRETCEPRCKSSCKAATNRMLSTYIDTQTRLCTDKGGDYNSCKSKVVGVLKAKQTYTLPECLPSDIMCDDSDDTYTSSIESEMSWHFQLRCEELCPSSCKKLSLVGQCRAQSWCSQSCVNSIWKNPKLIYGTPEDLVGNLAVIKNASGQVVLKNFYGTDSTKPDYDAVVRQNVGSSDDDVTLEYFDLSPPDPEAPITAPGRDPRDPLTGMALSAAVDSGITAAAPRGDTQLCRAALGDVRTDAGFVSRRALLPSRSHGAVLLVEPFRTAYTDVVDGGTGSEFRVFEYAGSETWYPRSRCGVDSTRFTLRGNKQQALSGDLPAGTVLFQAKYGSQEGFLQQFALAASGSLVIGERAVVGRCLDGTCNGGMTGPLGYAANVGTGVTEAGYNSEIYDLSARDSVYVHTGARLGKVTGTSIRYESGDASMGGGIATASFAWTTQFATATQGNLNVTSPVEARREFFEAPGRFGVVNVRKGGRLYLSSGTYHLDSLLVENEGDIEADATSGPVIVYVRDILSLRGEVRVVKNGKQVTEGSVPLLFAYAGDADVTVKSRQFYGSISAHRARTILEGFVFRGSVMARDITVANGVRVIGAPFAWSSLQGNDLCPVTYKSTAGSLGASLGVSPATLVVFRDHGGGSLSPVGTLLGAAATTSGACMFSSEVSVDSSGLVSTSRPGACLGDVGFAPMLALGAGDPWTWLTAGAEAVTLTALDGGSKFRRQAFLSDYRTPQRWADAMAVIAGSVTVTLHVNRRVTLYLPEGPRTLDDGQAVLRSMALLQRPVDQSRYEDALSNLALQLLQKTSDNPLPSTYWTAPFDALGVVAQLPKAKPTESFDPTCAYQVSRAGVPSAPTSMSPYYRPLARAKSATRVRTKDGRVTVAYYNSRGDNIRVVRDGVLYEDYEYDPFHNQVGSYTHTSYDTTTGIGTPASPAICRTFNADQLPTTEIRIGTDGADRQTTCFAYSKHGPWVAAVGATNSSTREIQRTAYDARGLAVSSTNETGESVTLKYDDKGRVTDVLGTTTIKVLDYDRLTGLPSGIKESHDDHYRMTTYEYDEFGHVKGLFRPGWGSSETWVWNDINRLASHTTTVNHTSTTTTYVPRPGGGAQEVKTPGLTTRLGYSASGYVTSTTFDAGKQGKRTVCMGRSLDGNINRYIDAGGREWTRSTTIGRKPGYGAIWSTVVYVRAASDPNCALPPPDVAASTRSNWVFRVVESPPGRVIETADSDGKTTEYGYDAFGRLAFYAAVRSYAHLPDRDIATHLYYDANDRVIAEIRAPRDRSRPATPTRATASKVTGADSVTIYEYPDPYSVVTTLFAANDSGALVEVSVTEEVYSPSERSLTNWVTAGSSNWGEVRYHDGFGRLVHVDQSDGTTVNVSYPSDLNPVYTTTPPGGQQIVRKFTLDEAGRVLRVEDGGGKLLSEQEYSATGNLVWTGSHSGAGQRFSYNAFGELTAVEDVASRTAKQALRKEEYTIDTWGRLSATSLGGKKVLEQSFDLLGRVTEKRRPTGPAGALVPWTYTYVESTQRVNSVKDPTGRLFSYRYDTPDRKLTSVTASAPDGASVFGPLNTTIAYQRVPASRRVQMIKSRGGTVESEVTRVYDGIGRVTQDRQSARPAVVRTYDGASLDVLRLGDLSFDYDSKDGVNVDAITTMGKTPTKLFQRTLQNGSEVFTFGGKATETRTLTSDGLLKTQTHSGGSILQYVYDSERRSRGTFSSIKPPPGSSIRLDGASLLNLDAAGRVTKEVSQFWEDASHLLSLDEITDADVVGLKGLGSTRSISLDAADNWIAVDGTKDWTPEPGPSNAYDRTPSGEVAEYDSAGRLTRWGDKEFSYDAEGNLARVKTSKGFSYECTYKYDAQGRRSEEACRGLSTRFAYDGDNLVYEEPSNGGSWYTVHRGLSKPVARLPGPYANNALYYLSGKDGSVRALFDAAGTVVGAYNYGSAFGETTSWQFDSRFADAKNRFGYQGHVYDSTTGLYQMRARYYSPEMGRFTTPDPIGEAGGLNLYAFVENRPQDFWDPYGFCPDANPDSAGSGPCPPTPCGDTGVKWMMDEERRLLDGFKRDGHVVLGELTRSFAEKAGIPYVERTSPVGPGTEDPFGLRQNRSRVALHPDAVVGSLVEVPIVDSVRYLLLNNVAYDVQYKAKMELYQTGIELAATGGVPVARFAVGQLRAAAAMVRAEGLTGTQLRLLLGAPKPGHRWALVGNDAGVGILTPKQVPVSGGARIAGGNIRHINGAVGEAHGWQAALDSGHMGVLKPGRVTATGPDFVTYNPRTRTVVVWDAKYRGPNGSYPSSISGERMRSWTSQARSAVESLPDSPMRAAVLDALNNGRVQGEIFRWPQ